MRNWFKKFFGKERPSEADSRPAMGEARLRAAKELLVQKLKAPKDFRVRVTKTGAVTAECKLCRKQPRSAEKDNLLWLQCSTCGGLTFVPLKNLQRDAELASEEGGVFEYELFLVRDLPPGLSPPDALKIS